MMRVLLVRLLDRIARVLRTLADSSEHQGTLVYRAHSRREAPTPPAPRLTGEPVIRTYRREDLIPLRDATPVEHIGGPDDGRWLPVSNNGARANGLYVVHVRRRTSVT